MQNREAAVVNETVKDDAPVPPADEALVAQQAFDGELRLAAAIERFVAMKKKEWTDEEIQRDVRRALGYLLDIVGDVPVSTIDRRVADTFGDLLLKIPSRSGKGVYAKMTAMEMIAKAEEIEEFLDAGSPEKVNHPDPEGLLATISGKTFNKHMTVVIQLFDALIESGAYPGSRDSNPFRGRLVPKSALRKQAKKSRRPFRTDEIERLFGSPQYTGHDARSRHRSGVQREKDGNYWIPLLMGLAGLRLEEACQLGPHHVVDDHAVQHISLTHTSGMQLEVLAAERVLPIHPLLKRLGFLEFVGKARANKQNRLFPELARGGHSSEVGDQLSECGSTQ